MGMYDNAANILFHAAMCIGTGSRNSFMGAVYEAYGYLGDHIMFNDRSEAINLYRQLYGHSGDVWPMMRGLRGGQWMIKPHMQELLMSVLFAYEYMVKEMGAARSPMDLDYS